MRAVLGILLAGGGLLLGYAVLTGKFPPASTGASSSSSGSGSGNSGSSIPIIPLTSSSTPSQTVLTPPSQTGLPTMLALSSNDVAASTGGM